MNDLKSSCRRAFGRTMVLVLALIAWTVVVGNLSAQDEKKEDKPPAEKKEVQPPPAKQDEKKEDKRRAEEAANARERAQRAQKVAAARAAQAALVNQQRNIWPDNQFEQWVFQQDTNAAGARRRMEGLLALQLDEMDRACQLSDAQKQKLRLMGHGDIKRIFDTFDIVKRRFNAMENDMNRLQDIMPDLAPVQASVQSGAFYGDSLLFKSLRHVLTAEQAAKYDAVTKERRIYRHRARIELAVGTLEQSMPMRDAQRRGLIDLLLKETKPIRTTNSYYDFYVTMDAISHLAEGKAKSLFTDAEWKILNRQLAQYRGIVPNLRAQGMIVEDDEAVDVQPAADQK
jgi:hypothetical protein